MVQYVCMAGLVLSNNPVMSAAAGCTYNSTSAGVRLLQVVTVGAQNEPSLTYVMVLMMLMK
jgi:hypothetical protein